MSAWNADSAAHESRMGRMSFWIAWLERGHRHWWLRVQLEREERELLDEGDLP